MRINTNVSSMVAQESSINTNKALGSSLEKLSSGLRINKASDDSSGMAIADKLRTQASGIKQGISNANSANTFIQIADKAMGEQSNILDTVKTKLLQASTSTTSDDGRAAIAKDINKMLSQFDQISTTTNYNGTTLLKVDSDNTTAASFNFQIGEGSAESVSVATSYASTTAALGGGATTVSTAAAGPTNINSTIDQGETLTLKDDTNVVITAGTASDKMTVSGKAGEVTLTSGDTITGKDQITKDLINAAGGTNGTINNTTSLNFGDNTVSFEATFAGTTAITMATTESLNVTGTTSTAGAALVASGNDLKGGDTLSSIKDASTSSDGLTKDEAVAYMNTIDAALTQLNTVRSEFGSGQNQVESAIRNMMTTQTNIKAAESVIRDVDYAAESANFNKQNIIAQAGTYAMSQANSIQQNVLKLLQ